MEKLLILNPGSTSTKIALYKDEQQLFTESIVHTSKELDRFEHVTDQFEFRRDLVFSCLKKHGIELELLTAVVSRGGLLPPIHSGAYEINKDMVWQLTYQPQHEHASNVGALIAYSISRRLNIPAFIYDGITVDELLPISRITGLPDIYWKGIGHTLNTRAVAMCYAREQKKKYEDITVIAVHLGGGITVNLHHNGRIEDVINDERVGFSPERAGALPLFDVIRMAASDMYTRESMMKLVKGHGGLAAHLGTTDSREVEKMIQDGDKHAKLIYDAMILNVSKCICMLAPDVNGKIDAILLTGGIAHSDYVTDAICRQVSFLAPVIVYPGEEEMKALALGGLRVLRGEEKAEKFYRTEEIGA